MTMLNGPRDNNSMQRTALSATADAERYNVNEAQEPVFAVEAGSYTSWRRA
jgi:hypothetical protein